MQLSQERKGEIMIFSGSLIWSLFPIITIFIYKEIAPIYTLVIGNLFACLFFFSLAAIRNKLAELKNKQGLKDISIATFFLSLLWLFVFSGMQYTTAGNTSIILLMEVFFSFLYFGIWHKEKFTFLHIFGVIMMASGAIFILFPGEIKFNIGDLMVLIGTTFPPLANHFQKKSRSLISTEVLLFFRYFISLPFLVFIAFLFGENAPSLFEIKKVFYLLVINGVAMFGLSKILWIESIHRISVTKAASLGTITPAFTLIFAYFLLNEIPTIWQLSGFLPIFTGAILITRK